MKMFLPISLLAGAVCFCNLGSKKDLPEVQPLFSVAQVVDQSADEIDRALGAPQSVEPVSRVVLRRYKLKDGSSVEFHMVNDKPIQVIACLKSRAETPQQALKYVGLDVGSLPPRAQTKEEAQWRPTVEGKTLDASAVVNTAFTLCGAEFQKANPSGSWLQVRVVKL